MGWGGALGALYTRSFGNHLPAFSQCCLPRERARVNNLGVALGKEVRHKATRPHLRPPPPPSPSTLTHSSDKAAAVWKARQPLRPESLQRSATRDPTPMSPAPSRLLPTQLPVTTLRSLPSPPKPLPPFSSTPFLLLQATWRCKNASPSSASSRSCRRAGTIGRGKSSCAM